MKSNIFFQKRQEYFNLIFNKKKTYNTPCMYSANSNSRCEKC